MFLGEYQVSFDKEKGRLALPRKIREELKEGKVVLTRGFENCIFGYHPSRWEEAAQEQLKIPVTDPRGREIRRYLFSAAMVCEFDNQGRLVLPKYLLEQAGITNEVTIIGAGDHFELWESRRWEEYLKKQT